MKSKKSKPISKPSQPENKPTLVAFLLDRSGSMNNCRDETISGFNAYIEELQKQGLEDMRFTLTQFDTQGIDIVFDALPIGKVIPLTAETYKPRAGTPLYDAIGKTVRATEATAGEKYKVLFVTLTDGQENSSSEWTCEMIQNLIKEKENKSHWTFAHIGVGADGWSATRQYSAGTRSCTNVMHTEKGQEKQVYAQMVGATMSYARNAGAGGQSVNNIWSGQEPAPKKEFKGKKAFKI